MYYFLAIVLKDDIDDGSFLPAYVLCQSYTTTEKLSGWRINDYTSRIPKRSNPKILVTEITGHEDMISFMSSYQKVGPDGKHFHPTGALCWFSCNQYGDPKGDVIWIKRVPEFVYIFDYQNRGWQLVKKMQSHIPTLPEVISKEPMAENMPEKKIKTDHFKPAKRKEKNIWQTKT